MVVLVSGSAPAAEHVSAGAGRVLQRTLQEANIVRSMASELVRASSPDTKKFVEKRKKNWKDNTQ